MEGGGWCGSDGNCYQRSLTDLGSSTKYPAVMGGAEGGGLYAQFATFNIVYMKYCGESAGQPAPSTDHIASSLCAQISHTLLHLSLIHI